MGKMIANNIWYRLALLWCGALLVTVMARGAAPVPNAKARLAILPLQTELESTADLLSVSLGKQSNVELVERQQIKKVLHELDLGGAQAQNQLKLGEVLAADGLLFLDRLKKDNREFLSLKFVAVKPGVVIHRNEIPWPLTDPVVWSGFAGEQYASLVPKLFVRKEEAIPVSLLSLHSSVITPETIALDRQLTDLLARNLMAQPKIFVLERQRLERLANEKDWQATNETFWNGAMVVEGVINPDGVNPGEIKIKARLTPHQGQPIDVLVEGKRSQLADVLNQLVAKVAEVLRTKGEKSTWDPVAESKKYAEEAKWQLRWGFAPEAQQAAESAWALGLRDQDMAVLRVNVYLDFAPTNNLFNIDGPYKEDLLEKHVYSCWHSLDCFMEAEDLWSRNKGTNDWIELGSEVLDRASLNLERAYVTGEKNGRKKEELKEIRAKVRKVAELMEKYQPGEELVKVLEKDIPNRTKYGRLLISHGGVWGESIEEGLSYIERGLKKGQQPPFLGSGITLSSYPRYVALAAWDERSSLDCEQMFNDMLVRLQKGENKLVAYSAYMLELRTVSQWYAFRGGGYHSLECFIRLWDFLRENKSMIVSGELPVDSEYLLNEVGGFYENGANWTHISRTEFVESCKRDVVAWTQQRKDIERGKIVDLVIKKLSDAGERKVLIRMMDLPYTFLMFQLDADSAERLLAAVVQYEEQYPNGRKSTLPLRVRIDSVLRASGKTNSTAKTQSAIQDGSKKGMITGAGKNSNLPQTARVTPPSQFQTSSNLASDESADLVLKLQNPVAISPVVPAGKDVAALATKDYKLMGRKLYAEAWIDCRVKMRDGTLVDDESFGAVISIDLAASNQLATLAQLSEPPRPFPGSFVRSTFGGFNFIAGDLGGFAVYKGDVFRVSNGKVWQYKVDAWVAMPWDLPDSIHLHVVNDRLLGCTSESLLELMPESGATKVLASTRIKPAKSALDALPDFQGMLVYSGGKNILRVLVGGKVFESHQQDDWRLIASFPNAEQGGFKLNEGAILYQDPKTKTLHTLLEGQDKLTMLLQSKYLNLMPNQGGVKNQSRWGLKYEINRMVNAAWNGKQLWVFLEGENGIGYGDAKPDGFRLLLFDSSKTEPMDFKIEFPPELARKLRSSLSIEGVRLQTSGESLLLMVPLEGCVFVIPRQFVESIASKKSTAKLSEWNEKRAYFEKRKKLWEQIYDSNGNGKIEPAELEEMNKNVQIRIDLRELKLLNEHKP